MSLSSTEPVSSENGNHISLRIDSRFAEFHDALADVYDAGCDYIKACLSFGKRQTTLADLKSITAIFKRHCHNANVQAEIVRPLLHNSSTLLEGQWISLVCQVLIEFEGDCGPILAAKKDETTVCRSAVKHFLSSTIERFQDVVRFNSAFEACAGDLARISADLAKVPPPDKGSKIEQLFTDDNAMLSPADLAKRFSVDLPALKKRLERLRQKDLKCFTEVADRGPKDPQFLYRVGSVQHVIDAMKKRPAKRPANVPQK
jgi:hypothetical protein